MVGFELENLLEQSGGPDDEALLRQGIRRSNVLIDRPISLPGADVKTAERVCRVPVERLVVENSSIFGNRFVQPAQTERLLGISQRGTAVDGHLRIR